jgi:hypothetical protein
MAQTIAPSANQPYVEEFVVPPEVGEEASSATEIGVVADCEALDPVSDEVAEPLDPAAVELLAAADPLATLDPAIVVAVAAPAVPDFAVPAELPVATFAGTVVAVPAAGAAVAPEPVSPPATAPGVLTTGAGPPVPQLAGGGAPGTDWMAVTERAVTWADRGA